MKKKQKDFIALRATGLSFDKISTKLNTHKSTLIEWSKLFQEDIQDLQFIDLQQLKEKYKQTTTNRYEQLLKHLNKIDKAMDDMDISKLSFLDLMKSRENILSKVTQIEENTTHSTNIKEPNTSFVLNMEESVKIKLSEL